MADWRDSHACGTAVLRVQAISLNDCDVYSYNSDLESDPFGKHGYGFEYGVPKRLLVLLPRTVTPLVDCLQAILQAFGPLATFFTTRCERVQVDLHSARNRQWRFASPLHPAPCCCRAEDEAHLVPQLQS